ncbi:hypothetical protein [Paracoccus aerius]|uniref:Uncharacterized protein n=1 Tax=Paracoccus aerius TaxID=1915382 RepID=A0ABS1SDH4_9RHOB|nr:hypothetical protein [Paracoccus aerius]MBL3675757.1 hypothetical protein [Paracoccus aerius]GHG36808.1 hypothetical protein GCM10017322_39540 [Paracoccus aerius]
MSSHDNKPAASRMPPDVPTSEIEEALPASHERPEAVGQVQSGKAILLNWCIMIVGFAAVAVVAYWLLG